MIWIMMTVIVECNLITSDCCATFPYGWVSGGWGNDEQTITAVQAAQAAGVMCGTALSP